MRRSKVWRARGESIHKFLLDHLDGSGKLLKPGISLPDEDKVRASSGMSWVAGAMDGVLAPSNAEQSGDVSRHVAALLVQASVRPTKRRLKSAYSAIIEHRAMDYIDHLLEQIVQLRPEISRIHDIGRWLASTAPDRDAVKVGIALLGVTGLGEDAQLIRQLGAHDEFTEFAVVAMFNGLSEPERSVWELAKLVDGWGRISCVERLRNTFDPDIRSWLVRGGFRNSIMYEYLAYIAAATGDLVGALRVPNADRELLTAAGEIIVALIDGGPAEDIDDYAEGADAIEAYVQHMVARAEVLPDLDAVLRIQKFLESEDGWKDRTDARCDLLRAQCREIAEREMWVEKIDRGLRSDDKATYWRAQRVGQMRGIDTFELSYKKILADPYDGPWFHAWEQADRARAERLVELVRQTLPFDEIATTEIEGFGFGPEARVHRALDWTLQALRGFSGVGGDLVAVGMTSALVRNRNMALRALQAWPVADWPLGARETLNTLAASDSHETVRELAAEVLRRGTH